MSSASRATMARPARAPGSQPNATAGPRRVAGRGRVGESIDDDVPRGDRHVVVPGGALDFEHPRRPQCAPGVPLADADHEVLGGEQHPRAVGCHAMHVRGDRDRESAGERLGLEVARVPRGEPVLGEGEQRTGVPEHRFVGVGLSHLVGHGPPVAQLHGMEEPAPPGAVARFHLAGGARYAVVRSDAGQCALQVGRERPVHGQHRSVVYPDHHLLHPGAFMRPINLLAYGRVMGMPALSEDLAFRGLVHQVTDADLPERLDRPGLTLYAGFDPSAASLHVGNLLQLCTLRRFQLAGHRTISLAGGGTGMIGDPGGKQDERRLLTRETIEMYLDGVRPQLAQFLDLDQALLLNNADWLGSLSTLEFLRDVGKHFTVNQMVAKESVRTRFDRPDQGISYTEFSYMLLQAYDFLRLHVDHGCDLQIGGSDQWGNITMGVELIRKVCADEVWGLTTPLVVKPDGTKYGKTESGTVWLDPDRTTPFAMYQFFVNTPDEQVGQLLRFLTFLDHAEIEALDAETEERPQRRSAQKALARAVTSLVHGEEEVAKCEEASAALFGEEIAGLSEEMLLAVTADAPTLELPRSELLGGLTLVDVLERTGLVTSRGEARRTVDQGGAYVNNVRQKEDGRTFGPEDLLHDRYVVLRRGRREVHIVRAT